MISINNVSILFGGEPLFESISFLINKQDRIGLAGRNGAGKSTMLKMIVGIHEPSTGDVAKPNDIKIAYLPQDLIHKNGKTVMEEAKEAFYEINEMNHRMNFLTKELETRTDYESAEYSKIIDEITDVSHRLEIFGSGDTDGETEKILMGLGFLRSDFDRLTDEFSGGWRMRIELAKLLLQKPDILLLDEPTNHLDIESIQWLEDFLQSFEGAVMLISHDKTFLDNITKRTIEIVNGKTYDYKANYTKYLELRKERRQQIDNAVKNQQKYIEHTQTLIDKYKAKASKASFAQSLMKKLDKLDIIESEDNDQASMHFRFPPPAASGKIITRVEDVSKSYGDKLIFSDANLVIEKGDKVAFVGKNGEGKSTLIKIINKLIPHGGNVELGHNVKIGYFAQTQADELDGNITVFETIDELAVGDIRKNVRNLLGAFLFSGDDVDKKVKVLSGGERNRLALCKLLLEPYNFLILDEPTNHLDIKSKDILKKALVDFQGTLILVSHDRDFLQDLTNKVYEFRNKQVKEVIGTINEYLAQRKIDRLQELEKGNQIKEKKEKVSTSNFDDKQAKDKEKRQLKNRIERLEKEIEDLEKEINGMNHFMNSSDFYAEGKDNAQYVKKYEMIKSELREKTNEWETLAIELSE
jgi:ATP-binding cassette, subfamily F, member 3